jgi:sortase A
MRYYSQLQGGKRYGKGFVARAGAMGRALGTILPGRLGTVLVLGGLGLVLYGAGAYKRDAEGSSRVMGLMSRAFGATLPSRLGTVLVLAGLGLVLYSAGAYVGLLPGGYTTLPEPVALSNSGERFVRLEPADAAEPAVAPELMDGLRQEETSTYPAAEAELGHPGAASLPLRDPPVPPPAASLTTASAPVAVKLNAADAADRRDLALLPRAGTPLRLEIPSIKVETEVKPAGIVPGKDGQPEWETLPFVAAHYDLLGPVGAPGNAVISGHVVTLSMGNVFRDLHQVKLGEPIEVFTHDSHFSYRVEEIKVVRPDAVEVMAPSEDARMTVITCTGAFDPRTRTFSDRLVVVGKLVGGERL